MSNYTCTPPDTNIMPNPEPKRSSATKPIMILLAVVGGLILLGVLLSALFSAAVGLNAGGWHLGRDGTELEVQAPNQWMNWCFFNCNFEDNQVTPILPEELNDGSLNADLDLNAGRLIADGDFDRLEVELGAGEANVTGSARELDAQLSAGSANLNLANVQTAELEVSAGNLENEL